VFWAEMEAKNKHAHYLAKSSDPKNIESGIWIFKENINKITRKNSRDFRQQLHFSYHILSSTYYNLGDFRNAIIYGKKALATAYPNGYETTEGSPDPTPTLNNLGVFYREEHQLDSSTYCFEEVLRLNMGKNDSVYFAIANGNLGENLYLGGIYKEALPMLQIDADMGIKIGDWGLASNSLVLIADIYLRNNDLEKAKQILDQATIAAHTSNQFMRLGKLYPIQSKYYKALGQSSLALAYADSTIFVMDSLKAQNYPFHGVRLEQFFNEYQLKIDAFEVQKAQTKAIGQRNFGLLFLLLSLFIVYLLFRQYSLKAKLKERTLLSEVEHVQDELAYAKEQLDTYIRDITAQNEAVHWDETKIATDEQWKKFLELFNKTNPDFMFRIKSRFTSITSGEIRLLCVARLGLDDLVMASILGVNVNSVRQTRRRFMRKSKIESIHIFKALVFSI
jgi:tetratricopeptide (TPR) repeat protein